MSEQACNCKCCQRRNPPRSEPYAVTTHESYAGNVHFTLQQDSDEVQVRVTREPWDSSERIPRPTLDEIDEAIDAIRCAQIKQRRGNCAD